MTKGLRTTASSKILGNYIAPYDATIIKKLKAAEPFCSVKLILMNSLMALQPKILLMGQPRIHLIFLVCLVVPLGAVQQLKWLICAYLLFGSDTGGSIRQPASFCGIYGLKTSYGRVSRFGLLSMTSSTDVIGPLTKTAYDAAMVLDVIKWS